MEGETPGHVKSIVPTVSQETISITHGVLPRADQPNRPAGTGHSAEKSSPSAIGPPPCSIKNRLLRRRAGVFEVIDLADMLRRMRELEADSVAMPARRLWPA